MLHPLASETGTSVVLYGDGSSPTWKPRNAYGIGLWIARRYWTFGGHERLRPRLERQEGDTAHTLDGGTRPALPVACATTRTYLHLAGTVFRDEAERLEQLQGAPVEAQEHLRRMTDTRWR
jgi:hypothetical protein